MIKKIKQIIESILEDYLEHHNGNFLEGYADVNWKEVNAQIEDKVKRLVRV